MECVYCGLPADTRDHVVPVTWGRVRRRRRECLRGTVPACRQCNSTLGNRSLHSVRARAAYLLGRYRRRYSAVLRMPSWCGEDVLELEGSLRQMVSDSVVLQDAVERRIAHLWFVSSGYSLRRLREELS